ncbi:hypothetical protein LSAT2_022742 [Lamellibrachia satsuma]|nr:hypothetical protein LSAT2_022742 [Lamellibrachia satsuma]
MEKGPVFEALEAYIRDIFPHAIEVEKLGERVTYRVPHKGLSTVNRSCIEEYSFSQSTLEQVFIEFAKHQYDDDASGNSDVLSRELSRQLSGNVRVRHLSLKLTLVSSRNPSAALWSCCT